MSAHNAKTCFQRKLPPKNVSIRGTKVSLSNSQLLVSTGVPTLDHILGGGIAVGSVLFIEEDLYGVYSKLLLKYWSAESVVCGHEIFLSSADVNPSDILRDLPDPIDYDGEANERDGKQTAVNNTQSRVDETEDLKIAFRYKHLNISQTATESRLQFGHYFDISKSMRSSLLESVQRTTFDPLQTCALEQPVLDRSCYKQLLQRIQETVTKGNFSTTGNSDHKNVLRIALHSIGSPLWSQCGEKSFPEFCYALRMLLRSSYAVCLMTVPTHLYQPSFTQRLEHLVDAVIQLESFVGTKLEDNPTFKEYHGLLRVMKLPQLNSLVQCDVNTEDLAFKLRRKRFTIEKFHLPPALPDSDLKHSAKPSSSSLTCGSKLDKLIDF